MKNATMENISRSMRLAGAATLIGFAALAPSASAAPGGQMGLAPAGDGPEAQAWICADWGGCAAVSGSCSDPGNDMSDYTGLNCHETP